MRFVYLPSAMRSSFNKNTTAKKKKKTRAHFVIALSILLVITQCRINNRPFFYKEKAIPFIVAEK